MFRYIKAMAYDRQTIMNNLIDKAEQLTDHLIKLYLFPSTEYVSHCRGEVKNFLNKMPKMKHNNKLPDKKLIYSGISGYLDQTYEMMHYMMEEYDLLVPERSDPEELYSMLESYFNWISSELSKRAAIPSSEIYSKLEEIGF